MHFFLTTEDWRDYAKAPSHGISLNSGEAFNQKIEIQLYYVPTVLNFLLIIVEIQFKVSSSILELEKKSGAIRGLPHPGAPPCGSVVRINGC
jgi:hypothetical protein